MARIFSAAALEKELGGTAAAAPPPRKFTAAELEQGIEPIRAPERRVFSAADLESGLAQPAAPGRGAYKLLKPNGPPAVSHPRGAQTGPRQGVTAEDFGAIGRGLLQGRAAGAVTGSAFLGADPAAAAAKVAETSKRLQAAGQPESLRRFNEAKGWGEVGRAFASDPLTITASLIGESLGTTALPLTAAAATSVLATPVAGAATMFGGSLAIEAGSKILESLAETGVDLTNADAVSQAFSNPEIMAAAKTKALKKGVPIAVFDALSFGIAGRVAAPVARTVEQVTGKTASRAAGGAAEVGVQAGLGAGGELAGEVTAGEDINPAAIAAEALAEVGTGAVEIGTGLVNRGKGETSETPRARTEPASGTPHRFTLADLENGIGPQTPQDASGVPPPETGPGTAPAPMPESTDSPGAVSPPLEQTPEAAPARSPIDAGPGGEGVASQDRVRANLAAQEQAVTPEQTEEMARLGIRRAIDTGQDQPNAVWRPDLGWITISYGDSTRGLAHILERRGAQGGMDAEAFVRDTLPQILARGTLEQLANDPKIGDRRAQIGLGRDVVKLSLVKDGDRESWVLSAFRRRTDRFDGKGPGAQREGNSPAGYATDPLTVGDQVGAGPAANIGEQPLSGNEGGTGTPPPPAGPALAVPPADGPRRAGNINLDRIYAPEDVKSEITRAATEQGGFEMGAAAESRGGDPKRAQLTRGKKAAARVIATKQAVPQAMWRDDVGWIAFEYDYQGGGFKHILEQRANQGGIDGNELVRELVPRVLAFGKLERLKNDPGGGDRRAEIGLGRHLVVLGLEKHGKRDVWVLTGYRRRTTGPKIKRADERREVSSPAPTHTGPRSVSGQVGAAPAENVSPKPLTDKVAESAPIPDRAESKAPRVRELPKDQGGSRTERADDAGEDLSDTSFQAGRHNVGPRRDDPGTGKRLVERELRREQIIADLEQALDTKIYAGRVKNKRVLGFYRRKIAEVRIKHMNDIETAAHEIAHFLDDHFKEISAQWKGPRGKAVADELRDLSYDAKKVFEGFAEFVRLWATQPEIAKKAPQFLAWWEGFLDRNPKIGAAMRQARTDMLAWFEQDAVLRLRSKIGDIEKTSGIDWAAMRQSVLDDLHGIARMEQELTGSVTWDGAYATARLTRGIPAVVDGAIRFGAPVRQANGDIKFVGKGLVDILKPVGKSLDEFWTYAVARSANELRQQGRENLFTANEIKAGLDLETKEFKTAFDEYQEWNRGIVDFAQSLGIINAAQRARWRRLQYIPFYRVSAPHPSGKRSMAEGDWKGIKALTGGTNNLRSIGQNVIENARMLIETALLNEARARVMKLAQSADGGKFAVRIPRDTRRVAVDKDQVERVILNAFGIDRKSQLQNLPVNTQAMIGQMLNTVEPWTQFWLYGQSPRGGNIVAVLEDGKPVYYEVGDNLLLRALMRLKRPPKHPLVRILSAFRRFGQAAVTLTPDFIAANMVRDTLQSGIFSRYGFRPMIETVRGLKSRIVEDEAYRDFLANGGGMSSYLLEEAALTEHLSKYYKSKGIDFGQVMHSPVKLYHFVMRIADATEAASRLGEFERARARGASGRRAAFAAREITSDFAMRGDYAPLEFFYDTAIFLNAGMVGMDRFYRAIAQDPHKVKVMFWTGVVALLSMALYEINRDNPLYDDLEDWDKDGHWHFFIPTLAYFDYIAKHGRPPAPKSPEAAAPFYSHWRLPRIWQIGAIGAVAERTLGIIEGDEKLWPGLKGIGGAILDQFNVDFMPQAFKPLYEQAVNRIAFVDRPIVTAADQGLEAWAQGGPSTNRTLRELGVAVRNIPGLRDVYSPPRVEALIRGYANTWGMYGLMLADAALMDNATDLGADDYPVLRRFYEKTPGERSKAVTEFYDFLRETTELRRTMAKMARDGHPELLQDRIGSAEDRLYKLMNKRAESMRELSKADRLVEASDDIERVRKAAESLGLAAQARKDGKWDKIGALKRAVRDELTQRRNKLARETMKEVEREKLKPLTARDE